MSKIITVTFNPSLDKTASVAAMEPERKLPCSDIMYDPGGGGINIARVITRLGASATAYYLAGGHNGNYLGKLLREERVLQQVIKIKGHTRENLVIADKTSGLQYRFNMPGPLVRVAEWEKCLLRIAKLSNVSYIVGSGSVPEGVPADIFARLAFYARRSGARFIVDTSGQPLLQTLEEKVYMIKPNLKELAYISGSVNTGQHAIIEQARRIISKGNCKVIVVSNGSKGAHLVTGKETRDIKAVKVKVVSTVGAGDSMVAGIVYGLQKKMSLYKAVKLGVACGTATTLRTGTHLCIAGDVKKIYLAMERINK